MSNPANWKNKYRQPWAQAVWLSETVPRCHPGEGARRPRGSSGQGGLGSPGQWPVAEGLALQVNLLTWWRWLAARAGGQGSAKEL